MINDHINIIFIRILPFLLVLCVTLQQDTLIPMDSRKLIIKAMVLEISNLSKRVWLRNSGYIRKVN